jgi:hypothetical protein
MTCLRTLRTAFGHVLGHLDQALRRNARDDGTAARPHFDQAFAEQQVRASRIGVRETSKRQVSSTSSSRLPGSRVYVSLASAWGASYNSMGAPEVPGTFASAARPRRRRT